MTRPRTIVEFHTDYSPTIKTSTKTNEELHVYDCPFCDKDQHLFYFPSNTAWDCKVCGRKGNKYSFIQHLYNEVCNKQLDFIVEKWKLPKRVFESIRYNPLNGTYVFPTFRNDKMNNLYKYVEGVNKMMCSPGITNTMMDWSDESHDEVWLCEGPKDKLAADAILTVGRDITPIALPGATSFQEGWVSALQGRKVVLIFDHDDAGRKGRRQTLDTFQKSPLKPASVQEVVWHEDSPEGFDLHDFYQTHRGKSWNELQKLIYDVEEEGEIIKVTSENVVEDFTCDSYDKALDAFSKAYYLTKDTRATLAMVMASIYSLNIKSQQLWLKVIGPPGCGKSTIAKAISASDYTVSLSTFTGLFSGWRDDDDKDPSLVPIISGRTLVVKDADALLRQKNIEKIMSELRDFYDKDSSVRYNNRRSYNYQNIKATFIMMGTQALRRADQSFLGERLLTIEMDLSKEEELKVMEKHSDREIAVALGEWDDPEPMIMGAMKGWINHLRDREVDTTLPPEYVEEIKELCRLTAKLRTQVDRGFGGKLLSPAMPETAFRLTGQCITASIALSVLFGENRPTDEIYQIVRKVLRDTTNPRSHRYSICDCMVETPGISAQELLEATKLDKNTIYDELKDLKELKFITTASRQSSVNPQFNCDGFILRPDIVAPFKKIAN